MVQLGFALTERSSLKQVTVTLKLNGHTIGNDFNTNTFDNQAKLLACSQPDH